jgi:hypothetical protein
LGCTSKFKKMHAIIKKGIVGKSPGMITTSITRECGDNKRWVGEVVKIALIPSRIHGMQLGDRSVRGC